MLSHKKYSNRILFAMGCALGAILFLLLFTAAPLNVTQDSWLRTGFIEKDLTQHYTGWLFFRDSAPQFPLGMTDQFNYPFGSSVTFTDSIPLFAIFFRLFEGFLPDPFQYFGLFSLIAYMLQGGAAMLLLSLFTQKLPALFCGTVLLVLNPVLIERTFRHTALSAQCFILFSLYLYFKNKTQGFAFRFGHLALLGLAVTIHPYFLPILFGILFADLLEHCIGNKAKELVKSIGFLLASFAVVLSVGYSIGIFSVPASGETLVGYGYFGMNLNTLWTPVSKGDLLWSSVVPRQNQGLGTVEGFNYLGLSVLCAAPLCAITFVWKQHWAGVRAALKKHCGMIFVCACLTIFALSNTWVANVRVLFTIPLPDALQTFGNIFRASGRMFWPVYYLIFLFVIVQVSQLRWQKKPRTAAARPDETDAKTLCADNAGGSDTCESTSTARSVSRQKKPLHLALCHNLGCAVLAILLVVQLADMREVLHLKRSFFTDPTPTFATLVTDPYWDEIAEHYDHLFSLDNYLYGATDVALYAASNGLTTNDGFTSRFDVVLQEAMVGAEIKRMQQGQFTPDTFYLTSDESTFIELAEATEGLAYAVRINWYWYAILPIVDGLPAPTESETLYVYPMIPLVIPDFSDDLFTNGIGNYNPATITLYLNDFTKRYLGPALIVYDEAGNSYDIVEYFYGYEGRFIITLDIEDAQILKGQYLTSDYNTERPDHAPGAMIY